MLPIYQVFRTVQLGPRGVSHWSVLGQMEQTLALMERLIMLPLRPAETSAHEPSLAKVERKERAALAFSC